MEFTVRLFPVSGEVVTVDFATPDDTAVAPHDYEPTRGTLTFRPGDRKVKSPHLVGGPLVIEDAGSGAARRTAPQRPRASRG
jgi:Calx-beta domain.